MTARGPRTVAVPGRHGLTLVELLVVMAIIGLMAAMLIPTIEGAREASRRMACLNNVRQVGLAASVHHDARGRFPAGSLIAADGTSWGLSVPLLPYLEEQVLFDSVVLHEGGACGQVRALQAAGKPDPAARRLAVLACPSDPQAGRPLRSGPSGPLPTSGDCGIVHPGNYLGVAGREEAVDATQPINKCYTSRGIDAGSGLFYDDSRTRMKDVTDGLSKTLAIGERGVPEDLSWGWVIAGGQECEQYLSAARGVFRPLPSGNAATADEALLRWWSWHAAGPHFALADGSARVISPDVDHAVFMALSTRAGGEVAAVP
jgi:prepilin-type N-terminal cleavage/methylation domain-containing protein